jgi:hypothetical protein
MNVAIYSKLHISCNGATSLCDQSFNLNLIREREFEGTIGINLAQDIAR